MRKTLDITKYEIEWQIVRSSIKGGKTSFDEKIEKALAYYEETKSKDRWERVYNWLEGLSRGYKAAKNQEAINTIGFLLEGLNEDRGSDLKEAIDSEEQLIILHEACQHAIKVLWEDLFRTNEKWLKKGYFHRECNEFMDWVEANKDFEVKERYSLERLASLRAESSTKKNGHSFFF